MKKALKLIALSMVLVMAVLALAACGPNSDPEKAKAALEDKGYEVLLIDEGLTGGLEATLSAFNEDSEDGIYIYYFESADDANDAYDDIEKLFELAKEADEDLELELKKSGKMVYYGTKQAIKDAA